MPNWCENVVEITVGSAEERDKVRSVLLGEEENFSFENTVPMPTGIIREPVSSDVINSGLPNWYNWSIENWGTKWDVSDCDIVDVSDTELRLIFDTAWSPAEAWVRSTSEVIPYAEFLLIYSEEGMDYSGFSRYLNGQLLEEVHYDEITYDISKMMGFSAEDFANRIVYSEDKVERYVEDADADKELLEAILAAAKEDEDADLDDGLLEKVKTRIAGMK